MERSKVGTKEKGSPEGLNYLSGVPSLRGRYAPKQWMNYLT